MAMQEQRTDEAPSPSGGGALAFEEGTVTDELRIIHAPPIELEALATSWRSLAQGYRRRATDHGDGSVEAQRLRACAITLESCADGVQGFVEFWAKPITSLKEGAR